MRGRNKEKKKGKRIKRKEKECDDDVRNDLVWERLCWVFICV